MIILGVFTHEKNIIYFIKSAFNLFVVKNNPIAIIIKKYIAWPNRAVFICPKVKPRTK